jgi:adenosylcobinamide kinase / adenosylcobinamide-phosphate guanylyltransferase
MSEIILIAGAARCGKSEWAERLAANSGKQVVYIATATIDPEDVEWQQRISSHQQRRPDTWQSIESGVDLAATIDRAESKDFLLIDSLGTWVANFLDLPAPEWQALTSTLLESLVHTPATVAIVAEETGWGVVPAYPSGRLFRDRLGTLSRQVSSRSTVVYLVVAGRAIDLVALGTSIDMP